MIVLLEEMEEIHCVEGGGWIGGKGCVFWGWLTNAHLKYTSSYITNISTLGQTTNNKQQTTIK